MLDVVDVELDTSTKVLRAPRVAAPAIDLGPAGYAGLRLVALRIAGDHLAIGNPASLGLQDMRPRPYDRHLTLEHVDELRQFVDSGPPQEPAETRDPRIVRHGERLAAFVAPVTKHG